MANDAFESLPPEILLNVVNGVEDLESLVNLSAASPHAWHLLRRHGVATIDRALDSAAIDKDTKTIIRTIAYVRQGCFPVSTVSDLHQLVTNNSITHGHFRGPGHGFCNSGWFPEGDRWYLHEDGLFSPTQLPDCTPATICSILATYRRIIFLTLDCLDFYLQRFRQLSPRRVADPGSEEGRAEAWPFYDETSLVEPQPIYELGPPTWVEEQAIFRAFWRIQFADDLKKGLSTGSAPGWTDAEREKFNAMSILEVYNFSELNDDIQEVSCSCTNAPFGGPIAEQSMILAAMDYLDQEPPPAMLSPGRSRLRPAPQPSLPKDKFRLENFCSSGLERFDRVFWDLRLPGPVLHNAYRPFGFWIWSAERLDGYGFFDQPGRGVPERSPVMFTWTSILRDEDVAAVKEAQRQEHARIVAQQQGRGGSVRRRGRGRGHCRW